MFSKFLRLSLLIVLIYSFLGFGLVSKVYAAGQISQISDFMTRNQDGAMSDHTIEFSTPTGVITLGQTVTFTFPTGFTVGPTVANNFDIAVSTNTGATSCSVPGGWTDRTVALSAGADTWVVAVSGQVITLTAPASGTISTSGVPTGKCMQVEMGATATSGGVGASFIVNQTAAQNAADAKILIAGTFNDAGILAVEIVASDQITVNATVDPTLVFSMTNTTLSFGHFTGAGTRYADKTSGGTGVPTSANTVVMTLATNATHGLTVYVRDTGNTTSAGIYSAAAANLILPYGASNAAMSTEGYAIYGNNKAAALTQGTGFSAADSGASGLDAPGTGVFTDYSSFVTSGGVPVASSTVDLVAKMTISGTSKAGTYVDTLTCVCTAVF